MRQKSSEVGVEEGNSRDEVVAWKTRHATVTMAALAKQVSRERLRT